MAEAEMCRRMRQQGTAGVTSTADGCDGMTQVSP
jgi:hypothetical protein